MSCPRCGSQDLWDDNLWWGCHNCGYAAGPDGGTMLFCKDIFGLPRHLKDIPGAYQPAPIYLVPDPNYNNPDDDNQIDVSDT